MTERRAVLIDIEGTIGPVSFVKEILFPYAAQRLAAYVAKHGLEPGVAAALDEASRMSNGADPLVALQDWQQRDVKARPLKTIQGWIWEEGYVEGAFRAPLFPDALATLRRWRADGLPIYVYSSGSIAAQHLYFAHSEAGDVRNLFAGFFDTTIGAKTEAASYLAICREIDIAPGSLLFLSDNPAELDAARRSGLQVAHVVKDDQIADPRFRSITNFEELLL